MHLCVKSLQMQRGSQNRITAIYNSALGSCRHLSTAALTRLNNAPQNTPPPRTRTSHQHGAGKVVVFNWGWVKWCISCLFSVGAAIPMENDNKNPTFKCSKRPRVSCDSLLTATEDLLISWKLFAFGHFPSESKWFFSKPASVEQIIQTQTENISQNLTSSFGCRFGQDGMCFPSARFVKPFLWLGEKWIFLRFKFIKVTVSKESDKQQQQNVDSLGGFFSSSQ